MGVIDGRGGRSANVCGDDPIAQVVHPLETGDTPAGYLPFGEQVLEGRLSGLRNEMDHASTLDHYQDVGRRGREVIIDVVDLVFTADMVPDGHAQPKTSDAKTRFGYIIQTYASGSSYAELRKLM